MAKPTTLRWTKLSIWPEDDLSPQDFISKVCGLTSKGFSITKETADSVVPDCDNPDDPAWIERVVRSFSAGVSGSGIMAAETFDFWAAWALASTSKKCRIVIDFATPQYFEGEFHLTSFELTGNEGDGKVQVSLTLVSDGPVTKTTGTP